MSLLILDATVIDGVSEKPALGQSIWLEDGRIKAIARRDELEVPPSVRVLDGRGKFIIPGLMDANVHLVGDIRMEQLVRYEGRYEELIAESAQVALKSGLTTLFDTWGPRQPLLAARARIESGAIPGSRIFCAGNIIGLDGPFSVDFNPKIAEVASSALVERINSLWAENTGPGLSWMTPQQVADEVRAYIGKGVHFIKYASSEHREPGPSAFLVFSPLVQSRIVEETHRAGLTAQAHTLSVEALRVAIEAGSDIIQHCNITGPVPIPEETLAMMLERKTAAVVFPFTEERLAMMQENFDAKMRRHWSTADLNCRALIASGATLLLGTDAVVQAADVSSDAAFKKTAMAAGDDNLFEMGQGHFCWLKAMEEKGCPPMQMLRAATRNIAVAYGKDAVLGTLEPGKIADLLVLEDNPLEAAKNYRSIETVIKDGKVVDRQALPRAPALTRERCAK